jgi:hypothetical protein
MQRALAPLLDLYPRDLRSDMADALQELLRDAVTLAREVAEVEARGGSFAEAVRDAEAHPLMAQVHYGLLDLLQTEFAPDERNAIQSIVDRAGHTHIDDVRRNWFLVAAEQEDAEELTGPLMRYLIYQAVRLNVWVMTWSDGAPLEAAGAYHELDETAEQHLRHRLSMDEMQDPAVRPLQVLVAEALEQLSTIWTARRAELATSGRDEVEFFANLARAAQVARNLGAADAALVRNELAGATTGEQLGSRELAARSPALHSQNATDQRRRRLLAKLRDDNDPEPSGNRFIDLLESR